MSRAWAIVVCALAATGCQQWVGEFEGEATISAYRPSGNGVQGVKDAKYPVRVAIRKGHAPAKQYPQGDLVLEITGAPFGACAMNVYETSQRSHTLNVGNEDACTISVDGYSGAFPHRSFVAFVEGDEITLTDNIGKDEDSSLYRTLNFRGKRR